MSARRRPQSGFTVIELLISLVVAVEVLIGAAIVFDLHNRMARVQTQITDMQQSLRIAQYEMVRMLRMAGRGGLSTPYQLDPGPPPRLVGTAVDVRNDVDDSDDSNQVALGIDQPRALPGSDILTLRGCFSTPLFQINPNNGIDFTSVGGTVYQVVLSNPSFLGIPQCLRDVAEQVAPGGGGLSGPMIFGGSADRSIFFVGEIVPNSAVVAGPATDCSTGAAPSTVTFQVDMQPNALSAGAFDPAMGPALACQVEEYRYYVREATGQFGPSHVVIPQPRLARARMVPGTETPWAGAAGNLAIDIADGIFDLQVALGFDSDYPALNATTPGAFSDDPDNLGNDDLVFEGADALTRTTDDWFLNAAGDDPTDLQWTAHQFAGTAGTPVDLLYLRLTLAARTTTPDPSFQAGDVDGDPANGTDLLEDNDYDSAPAQAMKTGENAKFRRRILQTLIDLRNIS
jgi:hypothetical protein